jgi:archaellum component FlaC
MKFFRPKIRIDSFYSNFSSESISVNSVAFQIRQNILNTQFNDLNEEYTSLDNYEDRFAKGLEISELLETTEFVYQSLTKLENAWEQVVELYTDVTLDPFTFNPSFKVLRKRRIVEAGEKVFYAYLEDIKNESSYINLRD